MIYIETSVCWKIGRFIRRGKLRKPPAWSSLKITSSLCKSHFHVCSSSIFFRSIVITQEWVLQLNLKSNKHIMFLELDQTISLFSDWKRVSKKVELIIHQNLSKQNKMQEQLAPRIEVSIVSILWILPRDHLTSLSQGNLYICHWDDMVPVLNLWLTNIDSVFVYFPRNICQKSWQFPEKMLKIHCLLLWGLTRRNSTSGHENSVIVSSKKINWLTGLLASLWNQTKFQVLVWKKSIPASNGYAEASFRRPPQNESHPNWWDGRCIKLSFSPSDLRKN